MIEGVTAFTPIYTQRQPTDFLTAVRNVIARYESVDNASYLNQMSQLLSVATETQQDQTLGNVKLEISISGDNAQFSLLYTENNVDFAAKSLQIVFENGILTSLSDDWPLYSIGSTQVNIYSRPSNSNRQRCGEHVHLERERSASFQFHRASRARLGSVLSYTSIRPYLIPLLVHHTVSRQGLPGRS